MRNDVVTRHCRAVNAAVSHLLDIGVEITSIHIGPTHALPVIRVKPSQHTHRLQQLGTASQIGGETHIRQREYELAWPTPHKGDPA